MTEEAEQEEREERCCHEERWSCGSMAERHQNNLHITSVSSWNPSSPNEHRKHKQTRLLTKLFKNEEILLFLIFFILFLP